MAAVDAGICPKITRENGEEAYDLNGIAILWDTLFKELYGPFENIDDVFEEESNKPANGSRKNGKAKFQFCLTEVLAILGGGFLGAILTRILFG